MLTTHPKHDFAERSGAVNIKEFEAAYAKLEEQLQAAAKAKAKAKAKAGEILVLNDDHVADHGSGDNRDACFGGEGVRENRRH